MRIFLCPTTPSRRPYSSLREPAMDWAQASEIAASVRDGRVSAGEVTEAALARIAAYNGALNAFTDVLAARARAAAAAIDRSRAQGDRLGPLAGVPFAVKNLFDVAG